MIQDLTEENKKIKEEFRKMRLDYEEFFSSFQEEMKNKMNELKKENEDQDKKIEGLETENQDLRNQFKSVLELVENMKYGKEQFKEEVKREINQLILEIDIRNFDEEQLFDYASLNRRFKKDELSNEELLEMLDELNQMKLSI